MGSPTRERDAVELVRLCHELWPRVISRTDFRDARLQSAEEREELLATAIAWVWEYRESLEGLSRADLEARLCTMLYRGAIKRAREVTGTTDSHSRRRVQESPIDLGVIEDERNSGAMDLLHARAQRAFEDRALGDVDEDPCEVAMRAIAGGDLSELESQILGYYWFGETNLRKIAEHIGQPYPSVREAWASYKELLNLTVGNTLAGGVSAEARDLLDRYCDGELAGGHRHWRERRRVQRLLATSPDCVAYLDARRRVDENVKRRCALLLPIPLLDALLTGGHAGAAAGAATGASGAATGGGGGTTGVSGLGKVLVGRKLITAGAATLAVGGLGAGVYQRVHVQHHHVFAAPPAHVRADQALQGFPDAADAAATSVAAPRPAPKIRRHVQHASAAGTPPPAPAAAAPPAAPAPSAHAPPPPAHGGGGGRSGNDFEL